MNLKNLILLSILLSLFSYGYALDPSRTPEQYQKVTWTSKNGLPQNSVLAIHQTRNSYLFFGTEDGLVRFDGVTFKVFDNKYFKEVKRSYVSSIVEDLKEPVIWVAIFGSGLIKYNYLSGAYQMFTEKDGLPSVRFLSMAISRDNTLYMSTKKGLATLKGGKISKGPEELAAKKISKISLDGDDKILFLEGSSAENVKKVFSLDLKTMKVSEVVSFPGNTYTIFRDSLGRIWAGTLGKGVFLYNHKSGKIEARGEDTVGRSNVSTIFEDSDKNIWVTTFEDGIFRFRNLGDEKLKPYDRYKLYPAQNIFEDREGNIWIGSIGKGLTVFKDSKFAVFSGNDYSELTASLIQRKNGDIYFGTFGSGLFKVRDLMVERVSFNNNIKDNSLIPVKIGHPFRSCNP